MEPLPDDPPASSIRGAEGVDQAPPPATTTVVKAPAQRPGSSLAVRLLFVALLGVVVYGVLVVVRGTDKIAHELATFEAWTFAAACGLSLANYGLRFLKWEYYLGVLGIRRDEHGRRIMPVHESLLVFLSGFVLTITPGKVGEVFKSLVLKETRGIELEVTAPIVGGERVTDLVGIIVLVTVGGATFPGGLLWAAIGAGLVGTILVVVAFSSVTNAILGPFKRLPGSIGRIVTLYAPRIEKALEELRVLTSPKHLVIPSLLSILGWSLEGIGVYVVLRGFHATLDPPRATFFYATGTLAGALVPVPGGLGVTEKVLEESMVKIGQVPGAIATATMILSRLATLWFAVVVGFVSLGALRMKYPTLLSRKTASST